GAPDQKLRGEWAARRDGVTRKDGKNQLALWLLGISDYQNGDYANAIARWKFLLPLLQPDSDVARSVRNEIADAEARRDGREPPQPEAAPAEAPAAETAETSASASAPRLTVTVTLDPKL